MRAELSRLVGAEHVLDAPPGSPYNFDATRRRGVVGRADAVVRPGSAEEVAAVVAWCYDHDVAVVPRGGGTGLVGGAVPVDGGLVLSLERLRRVRELEPGLWRMLPEAGVTTRHVQRIARENGLMFAPDPGGAEQSQIGGNVATNAGGPHALKYGVTGAWVTGLEAVLAPGELIGIGGWIRKDVAGYDLKDLLVGSEGTLGIITAVRLALLPAPEAAIALVVFLASAEQGCTAVTEVLGAGLRPSVLDFLDGATLALAAHSYPGVGADGAGAGVAPGDGAAGGVPVDAGFALLVEVDGSRAEAAAQREELVGLLGGAAVALHEPADRDALWRWRDGLNPVVTAARGAKVSGDVVVGVERLGELLRGFAEIAESHDLISCAWGHAGEGNIHATVLVDPEDDVELDAAEEVSEELYALTASLGGSIAGEHGVGVVKGGRLLAQWSPRAIALHEEIKRAFDPKGLLNPGKKLAR